MAEVSDQGGEPGRWGARPVQAWTLRGVIFLAPFVVSFAFVRLVTLWIHPPTSSLWMFLGWWFGISGVATVVLIAVDRLSRRLLPLSALLKLSLAFPDETPSRLKTALRARWRRHAPGPDEAGGRSQGGLDARRVGRTDCSSCRRQH